jgi:predicted dehydrogenase
MAGEVIDEGYGLSKRIQTPLMPAPDLPYRPPMPKRYRPRIGLIGCGGITENHLTAYKHAGWDVVALCDVVEECARTRQAAFFPEAACVADYRELLARDDVDVIDIATHPEERVTIIEAAAKAKKHILSQKPFVLDLDVGERLVELAEAEGVKLAVNQNGRWAPHFSYMRHAVDRGYIGTVSSVEFSIHWDHNWVKDTVFNKIEHLILYDFAIHWFDMACVFFGTREALQVYAAVEHSAGQQATPALLAHAAVTFDGGLATFAFNADTVHGQEDRTTVIGSKGTMRSVGPGLTQQAVTLYTAEGHAAPALEGCWFPDGFQGAMGELLCAIEEDREPWHSARANLRSLALCFAAVESATTGAPQAPWRIRGIGAG